MPAHKILLIERDATLAAAIAATLEDVGFKVRWAAGGAEGVGRLYEDNSDVLIMADDMLSAEAGQICRRVLEVCAAPVIVLDGGGTGALPLLEAGADACMGKPPHLRELVARVRSMLRRGKRAGSCGSRVRVEPSPVWGTRRTLRGQSAVGHIEFRLLSCLVRNEGKVVENARLISEVWGEKQVTDQCLRFYIRRLREKLATVFGKPGQIINERGVGYLYSETLGRHESSSD